MNLYTALKKAVEKFPKKTAVFYEDDSFNFSEVLDKIDRFAKLLKAKGIKKGDNVTVLLRNKPELIYSFFACWKIGAAMVPLNFFYTTDELIYILNDSRALILISDDSFKEHFTRITEEANNIKGIISWDNLTLPDTAEDGEEISSEDTAAILYTSGTTGHPKGAILTHRNFLSDVESCRGVVAVNHKDRAICFLPLFHSFALTVCLLLPVLHGGSVVLLPRILKGPKFLKLIFKRRITLFVSIPQVYSLFVKVPSLIGRIALWSVNYFVSGADALPVNVLASFEKKFHKSILEGYGLTEAAPVVTFNPPELRKPGYIGKALPGIEIKIVNSEGKEMPVNEIGELIIKGDNVMKGYFEYPEATKNALRGGWLYTGDLGFKDEDDYIKIMDRKTDMFVCRGLNVYPREIENVLRNLPQIEEAAVKGQKLKEDTMVAVAYIKKQNEISSSEIIAFCRKRLANYKVPHHIIFVEDFPRTATGKISKKDIV
ncbi:AMP-binding protein [bacterium]|nr:AMP-binding protein [bacterium]MBU3929624.1 AMP-binding protein [bacterium]MBU4122195.1 AMP-binding protein [bacterium]